jgi:hypothetical protein
VYTGAPFPSPSIPSSPFYCSLGDESLGLLADVNDVSPKKCNDMDRIYIAFGKGAVISLATFSI